MTTSIFGFDLSQPAVAGPTRCGPVHGTAARTMMRDLAEHFDLPLATVAEQLAPFFPRARGHLHTPAGWVLLAEYLAFEAPAAPRFSPSVH